MTDNSVPVAICQEPVRANGDGTKEAERFLSTMYGNDLPTGEVVIFTAPGEHCYWHSPKDLTSIAKAAISLSKSANVYFGISLQDRQAAIAEKAKKDNKSFKEISISSVRGGNATALAIPCLWVEIDIAGPGHKATNLPPTLEAAVALAYQFPLPPTMIVFSGHGIHCYWLLRELWGLESQEERQKALLLERRFQLTIRAKAKIHGWHVDPTADLARVLRVPGTVNRKSEVLPVQILELHEDRRYNPSDFEEFLIDETAAEWEMPKETSGKNFRPAKIQPILDGCGWLRHCRDDAATLPEPEWYPMLGIVGRCEDGRKLAHEWSLPYPEYSETATDKKLDHALKDAGPPTCLFIQQCLDDSHCRDCLAMMVGIKSPIVLGNLDPKAEALEEARKTVDGLIERTKTDEGAPFEPDMLDALLVLRKNDPAEWVRLEAGLRKIKVRIRELERAIKERECAQLETEAAIEKTIGETLPDAPFPELVVPFGYYVDEETTGLGGAFAYAPVLITGRLRDDEEGTEALRLEWRRPNGWRRLIADRGTVLTERRLVELASSGFPVASDNAKALVHYLHLFEAKNRNALPSARSSSHLGWQGKNGASGFLWGKTLLRPDGTSMSVDLSETDKWTEDLIAFRGQTAGDEQIASAYHASGDIDGWKRGISVIKDFPRVLAAFYASFVPPLLQIVNAQNFVFDSYNRTSTGKTTSMKVAGSAWGRPDERSPESVIGTWDATKVWLERASAIVSGLPLILDDTKRAKDSRIIADMLYAVVSGRGRGRGSVKSTAMTRTWRTVMLSTGEQSATSFTQDGGTRMRCLKIRGLPFGKQNEATRRIVDSLNANIQTHYGHAGPAFVKYLIKQQPSWERIAEKYRETVESYASRAVNEAAGRLAQYAAIIDIAALLAHRSLDLPWEYKDPLESLWAEISAEAADAAGELRALRDVMSWAFSRAEQFYGRHIYDKEGNSRAPSQGWAGRWSENSGWEEIAFYPNVLKGVLKEQGYEAEAILAGWKEKGWLNCDEGRHVKLMRIDGERHNLVAIRREAVDEGEA